MKTRYFDIVATDAATHPRSEVWSAIRPWRFVGKTKGVTPLPMVHNDNGVPAASVGEQGELWFEHHAALELGHEVSVESFTTGADA